MQAFLPVDFDRCKIFFVLCGLIYVSMGHLGVFVRGTDVRVDGLGNGYRAVPAPGAADRQG